MPAVWFDSPLANAGAVLVGLVVLLLLVRRLLLAAATSADTDPKPRRPGPGALPAPRVCTSADCGAPNRTDARYCRRCGTRLG